MSGIHEPRGVSRLTVRRVANGWLVKIEYGNTDLGSHDDTYICLTTEELARQVHRLCTLHEPEAE